MQNTSCDSATSFIITLDLRCSADCEYELRETFFTMNIIVFLEKYTLGNVYNCSTSNGGRRTSYRGVA